MRGEPGTRRYASEGESQAMAANGALADEPADPSGSVDATDAEPHEGMANLPVRQLWLVDNKASASSAVRIGREFQAALPLDPPAAAAPPPALPPLCRCGEPTAWSGSAWLCAVRTAAEARDISPSKKAVNGGGRGGRLPVVVTWYCTVRVKPD